MITPDINDFRELNSIRCRVISGNISYTRRDFIIAKIKYVNNKKSVYVIDIESVLLLGINLFIRVRREITRKSVSMWTPKGKPIVISNIMEAIGKYIRYCMSLILLHRNTPKRKKMENPNIWPKKCSIKTKAKTEIVVSRIFSIINLF